MTENQSETTPDTTAAAETAVQEPPYSIRVEDVGPAAKKVWVEIPKEKIAKKIADQYKELRQEAAIPGFRKGRAPQKLLEKKFSTDVKEQVRRSLISESYEQAVELNALKIIGEPEFENPDQIQLKEDEGLTYAFSVEIQPDINLPELKGIKVKKPKIQVTEDHVNQAMTNLREQQGTMLPVEDRGVQERDHIIADIHAKVEGNEVAHQHGAQLRVLPGRIAGVDVPDLPTQIADAKPGETRTLTVKLPDTYPNESLRGKDVQIELSIKEIKHLEPAEINKEFLDDLGFTNDQELRDALREQMVERIDFDVKQAMRRQVLDHLLQSVEINLPTKLTLRQTDRIVNRRAVDLMMRGVSQEQIQANVERLRAGAAEEGARELKAFFILQAVAEKEGVDVTEPELNGRIATIALQQGRRPERLKQELAKDTNMLAQIYVQMREEKALDTILQQAEIEEVEPTAAQQAAAAQPDASAESSAT